MTVVFSTLAWLRDNGQPSEFTDLSEYHNGPSTSPEEIRAALIGLLPEIRGFARFLVRDRSEADDLVQEALVRALRALSQFRSGSNLRAWVFTILRNVQIEQRRRQRTEAAVIANQFAAEEAIGPAQQDNAELADLQSRLWALSPVLREALILVGAQGLNYDEAAEVCAVPVGTMKARVARARRQLAEALKERAVQSLEPIAHS